MVTTVTDFWANVARGQDCISEIPSSRRPLDHFYDPYPKASSKTYSQWMGVLEDIDKFDPHFFCLLCSIVADQDLDHKLKHIMRALKQHNIVLPDTPIPRVICRL
jgi:Beta-ketoacyl synthase, N-terminal domain